MRYLTLGEIVALHRSIVDEQEQLMLGLATSRVSSAELVAWLRDHTKSLR